MIRIPFLDGWTVGPKLGAFEARGPETWRPVTLPHDAIRDLPRSAESDQGVHTGYHPGGVFEYEKTFDVPVEWRDKTVIVEFEGVYRDAAVFLNGDLIAHEPNGYSSFSAVLDPYLRFGDANRLTVEAKAHKDSRWYSGAGIYRPVHLVVADPLHFALDGLRVTTPDIDAGRAVVAVAATVENDTRHARTTRVTWSIAGPDGSEIATTSAPVTVLPGEAATARARLVLPSPRLWSVEDPALHVVDATLNDEQGTPIDRDTARFGIRRLQLDPQHGLRINGEVVKLRGACVHHDNGALGSATIDAAEDRRVRLLKAAGFNALRSAHNPMSRAMLDACDRHGVLVMDELTDVWTRSKTAFDGAGSFPDRWERDVAALVAKDFNHPSVVLYSIGNEILELGTPAGAAWGRRLAEGVRALDDTRFVTNGINGIIANLDRMSEAMAEAEAQSSSDGIAPDARESDPNTMMAGMGEQMARMNASQLVTESTEEAASVLDVVGFNYADSRYELDAELFPHRVIVGSETFPEKIDVMWGLVERLPHVIGDFTWTGWDYLGEAGIGRVDYTDAEGYVPTGTAGPYPYLLAESGDLDITGHRRTISYYREIVFGLRTDPYIAVHRPQHHGRPIAMTPWSWHDAVSSWTWDAAPGEPVLVDVYAEGGEVELLLDGVSLGVAPVGEHKAFLARFVTEYRPGELVAVARTGGVETGRHVLRTAGEATLVARAEEPEIAVDGLAFVGIVLEDAAGSVPCDADVLVTVQVEGPAVLAGVGTGRARTEESLAGPSITTYDGRALAIVRPTGPGEITVTVSAAGRPAASVSVVAA
ncbi:glycoside hydrolase family 2 TIM barrel-domain containing protein [Microbacterium sp. SS28]|uniref:glycoside hydrolase family 2 TIM barrel-domain containing protein n=1 Tax=Microbacterium sp. SS28 TaxID=2919948 RepID=UPI001FAA3DA0|nr:glycoside hydrolase family 2 TIM barrel-domain containing protein [Microbacterium sp. SS28]